MKFRWGHRFDRGVSICLSIIGCWFAASGTTIAQNPEDAEPVPARLAILLDTSVEMGFIVPQVRKEVRFLNAQLELLGRPLVELREINGAGLDRENSLAVPARRNVLHALKKLYEDSGADTVYWITSLRGLPSDDGFFAVNKLLQETGESHPPRRLIIRNLWQDQIQAGDAWVSHPPGPELDPLDPRSLPGDWFRLVANARGLIIRSWQNPPDAFRAQFGFPYRITNGTFLRKLGYSGRELTMDTAWERDLAREHGLSFMRPKEEWIPRVTGRRWIFESCLVPFVSEETFALRAEAVFEGMCARESIEEDLARIDARKIGVLLGFGFFKNDLDRLKRTEGRPPNNWRLKYIADLARVVAETREHQSAFERNQDRAEGPDRVYVTELVELHGNSKRSAGPDPHAVQIAKLVRDAGVDAIYLFTDGHVGGGEYGTWGIDIQLIALAIREAGVPLYLRVPFEFGPAPIALQRLALASGGGLFLGTAEDEDWNIAIPSAEWPEPSPLEKAP